MRPSVLDNISTPGTSAEFEEALRAVPEPPTDFNVKKAGSSPEQVKILIGDRLYVAQRHPTNSYRVYYTPLVGSGAQDLSDPQVRLGIVKAGQVVTTVGSQGKGNTLTAFDSQFQGKQGYFSCVAVNSLNVESVCLHVCPSPWNGPVGPPSALLGTLEVPSGVINGVNLNFTLVNALGPNDLVFVDGVADLGATAIGLALTVSVAPTTTIIVLHGATT